MIIRTLFFLVFISHATYGQNSRLIQHSSFAFIDSILDKDNFTVEFLDFVFSEDIQEITLRFQKSMAENKEWAEEYLSVNIKPGEVLPYHEKFGITKEEYQKIIDLDKTRPGIVVKETGTIKSNRTDGMLTFSATGGNNRVFELLKIDFKHELLIFSNDTIPFHSEINTIATNPFGEWHGYSWLKEISNLEDGEDFKLDELVSKIIEINFGRLKSNNKLLFRLKYKGVDKGEVKANVEFICYLD